MVDSDVQSSSSKVIWTVGHSNSDLEEFLKLVRDIELLGDVRRFPYSPRFSHFNGDNLRQVKEYRWFQDLGGRRREKADRHPAWRVAAFRA